MRRLKKTKDLRAPISEELLGKICCAPLEVCYSEYKILLCRSVFSLAFYSLFMVGELVYTSEHCAHVPLQIGDIDMLFSTSKCAPVSPFPYGSQKLTKKERGIRIILPSHQQSSSVQFISRSKVYYSFMMIRFQFNTVLRFPATIELRCNVSCR